jgi:CheY-like chemotaxis protein
VPTILHIDDDAGDARLLAEAIAEADAAVSLEWLPDATEALARFRRERVSAWPDLVLLDLNMPRMGGRQFLEQRRDDARLRQLPLVVLSTSGDPVDADECHALGADGYLIKPVEWAAEVEQARRLCAFVREGRPLGPGPSDSTAPYQQRQTDAWRRWMRARRTADESWARMARSLDALAGHQPRG